MPMNMNSKVKEPTREEKLLEMAEKQFGLNNTILLEELLKNKKKQVQESMLEHGTTAENIAKGLGMDLDSADLGGQSLRNQQLNNTSVASQDSPQGQTNAPQQGNDTLKNLLMAIGGGLAAAGGNTDIAKALLELKSKQQQSSKGVYGFDKATGKVSLQGEIPAGSELREMQPNYDLSSLEPMQQTQAWGLARKIGGVRGAEKILPTIVKNMQQGVTPDKIEDSLRMASQSPEFQGPLRDAAQSISVDKTESQRNVTFDALDDYVQRGDTEGAKDYLKRMAITSGTADQQNQIMTKERTNEFLGEIRGDLETLEKNGINTSFLKGGVENLKARIGQVQDPEMRKVATKIAIAVMNYRRSMTGVQFGMIENEEYKRLFPSINKVGEFNTANLDALEETLGGDLKKFYSISMGKKNYDKLFGSSSLPPGYSSEEWEVVK